MEARAPGHWACAVRYLIAAGHEAVAAGLYAEAERRYLGALDVIDGDAGGARGGGSNANGGGGEADGGEIDGGGNKPSLAVDIIAHLLVSLAEIYTRFGLQPSTALNAPALFVRAERAPAQNSQEARCFAWALHGECDKNREYMWRKCRDACEHTASRAAAADGGGPHEA